MFEKKIKKTKILKIDKFDKFWHICYIWCYDISWNSLNDDYLMYAFIEIAGILRSAYEWVVAESGWCMWLTEMEWMS